MILPQSDTPTGGPLPPPVATPRRKRNPAILAAGLLLPGGGALLRGRIGEAVLTAATVAYFAATALVGLIVHNHAGFPSAHHWLRTLAALPWPPQVAPATALCGLIAVTVHAGCAWAAAREFDDA